MATRQPAAMKAHVAIYVKDIVMSTEFYRSLFGIEPARVRARYAKFDVANPPLNFSLHERANVERGNLSHLGIQVGSTEEVMAWRQRWVERGLLPRDEMQTTCCFAVQDKTWVRDPDGNEWEVFVVLEDHLPEKKGATSSCCADACCA
jgi:catechol 2,3-dioxygenase-like lactoylglutathione lyase family enzyme